MTTDLNLNEVHVDLISKFLQLTRYQETQRIKSVDHCFTNLLNYKIREDETYNGDEVIKLVQDLQDIVLDEVKSELLDSIHTNVLLVQQLLKQAEEWHLTLTANISELENREKLNVIKNYDEDQRKNPEKMTITASKHQVIPVEDYGAATALKHEVVTLLAENDILKKKVKELEAKVGPDTLGGNEVETASSEKVAELSLDLEKAKKEIETLMEALANSKSDTELENVQGVVEKIRLELETSEKSTRSEMEKLRHELESREDKLRQVQSNLLLTEKELEKKFQATGAYANMKKILMQKNTTIKNLRKKLAALGVSDENNEESKADSDGEKNEEVESGQ